MQTDIFVIGVCSTKIANSVYAYFYTILYFLFKTLINPKQDVFGIWDSFYQKYRYRLY